MAAERAISDSYSDLSLGKTKQESHFASKKLYNLQVLRFFAAFLVLIYHVAGHYHARGGESSFGFLRYVGYSGVDVFFVISGFIIHRTTRDVSGILGALRFAYRRACRIFIPYWPILLAWLAILAAFGSLQLVETVVWWKAFLLWPAPFNQIVIDVTWTLSYELYFYLVFAIAIALGRFRWVVLGLFVAVTAACSIAMAMGGFSPSHLLSFVSNPMIIEFMFGVVVSLLALKYRIKNWAVLLTNSVLGFVIVGLVCMYYDVVLVGAINYFFRVATYGVLASVLVYAVVCMEPDVRPTPSLVMLGDASYSLYLIHRLVISLVWGLWPSAGMTFVPMFPGVAGIVVCLGSISLALFYFAYVERPLLALAEPASRSRAGASALGSAGKGHSMARASRGLLRVAGAGVFGMAAATSVLIAEDTYARLSPFVELPAWQLRLKGYQRAPADFPASDTLPTYGFEPRLMQSNHLVAAGSDFIVKGNDPYLLYTFPAGGIPGDETPYIGFDFTCGEQATPPTIEIFWWGDGAKGPTGGRSAVFRLYRDTIVVPIGVSPDWSSTKALSGIRVDLANSDACRTINVSNLRFFKFDRG